MLYYIILYYIILYYIILYYIILVSNPVKCLLNKIAEVCRCVTIGDIRIVSTYRKIEMRRKTRGLNDITNCYSNPWP